MLSISVSSSVKGTLICQPSTVSKNPTSTPLKSSIFVKPKASSLHSAETVADFSDPELGQESELSSFNFKQRRSNACSPFTPRTAWSRRSISFSLVAINFFSLSNDATGASILDNYVKKKKLDPLETYIPAVLLTGLQMKEIEHSLEGDQPKFADCRSLLRSGPASSFRVNIRAVAQYVSDAGDGKSAFNAVDQCLSALEELDSLLLQASRNQSDAPIEQMKLKILAALNAMDRLLKFVPLEVLNKGKAMADAYFIPEEYLAPEKLDPQLKQLESILK